MLFCRSCKTDTPVSDFTPYQQTAPYPRCKPCVSRKSSNWYRGNREHRLEVQQEWLSANREKARLKCKAWREANPEKGKATSKRYNAALRQRVLEHYGRACACCSDSIERFLTIDHINNDGAAHRKEIKWSGSSLYVWLEGNGFPPGFQTLCYNCNIGRHQNGGICPHKDLMKHPDQDTQDEVHEIKHPVGHGLLDSRRDLHNRSPHAMNTPIVGSQSQPPMDPTQSY